MAVRSRHTTMLRQVVAVLLTAAFLLAPYHSHGSASNIEVLVVAAQAYGVDHPPGDGAPTQPDGDCVSCFLMKQVQLPRVNEMPLVMLLLVSSQLWSGDEFVPPTRAIFGVFRPPIFIAA